MRLPIVVVDAFTKRVFAGNPAAVCVLERWLDERLMQAIATENNLSETAFLVGSGGSWELRWFTPTSEIDLCGHATLASAHVLYAGVSSGLSRLDFTTKSGVLTVTRDGDRLSMDFPRRAPVPKVAPPELIEAIGKTPVETLFARDWVLVFEHERDVLSLKPRMDLLARVAEHGAIATARGSDSDYVLRFFVPAMGVPEDPVTGSVQCALVPFWSERLGKRSLFARQISRRGGELHLEDLGSRVRISGYAVRYSEGTICVAPEDVS